MMHNSLIDILQPEQKPNSELKDDGLPSSQTIAKPNVIGSGGEVKETHYGKEKRCLD